MLYVPQFCFPFINLCLLFLICHQSIGLGLTQMFINFSQLYSLNIFVFLVQKELFSLSLFILFSSSTQLIVYRVKLLLFDRVNLNSFLLTMVDHSFEISFSFVKLEPIRLFIVVWMLSNNLMEIVEGKLIVGIIVIKLWTVRFFRVAVRL